MSIIDEVMNKYKDAMVSDGIHPTCTRGLYLSEFNKVLESLRPYVELGEMVAYSKLVDTKGPKGVLRLTLEFEHKQGITLVKLLQQIREQENGRTE